jgi:RNA polymerase sigma-70 factor (ECF subfamily)
MDNVKEIIEGCINNNRKYQEILFKYFYGRMFAVCLTYVDDEDEATDILQEGFIKVFNSIHKFNSLSGAQLHSWIKRIVSNTAIDHLRARKRLKFASVWDIDDTSSVFNEIEETENMKEMELKINKALELIPKLSPAYRTVFVMYAIEEYSHKEIAEMLGIDEGTSKSNFFKARNKIKTLLQKEFVY